MLRGLVGCAAGCVIVQMMRFLNRCFFTKYCSSGNCPNTNPYGVTFDDGRWKKHHENRLMIQDMIIPVDNVI